MDYWPIEKKKFDNNLSISPAFIIAGLIIISPYLVFLIWSLSLNLHDRNMNRLVENAKETTYTKGVITEFKGYAILNVHFTYIVNDSQYYNSFRYKAKKHSHLNIGDIVYLQYDVNNPENCILAFPLDVPFELR